MLNRSLIADLPALVLGAAAVPLSGLFLGDDGETKKEPRIR